MIKLHTNHGVITLELFEDKAPETVANFKEYVKAGHYDGTVFHRVISNFMIQGGGFSADMEQKKTDASVKIESTNGLKNARGTIAMARTSDPNSATSQFFINLKDNNNLDYPSFDGHGYTVFGKVTKGLEAVDAIAAVPTTRKGPHGDVPVESVTIKTIK
eukprot:gene47969-58757_t